MYSAINTDIAVAINTPGIPIILIKVKDKIKFTIVSVKAQYLVSLNNPLEFTKKTLSSIFFSFYHHFPHHQKLRCYTSQLDFFGPFFHSLNVHYIFIGIGIN